MNYLKPFSCLLLFLLSISAFSVFAQPVNDECSGATPITHDPFPVYYAANITGATASMSDNKNDIWFYFTATDTTLFVRLNSSPMTYEIYSGTCGNLSLINTETAVGGWCADIPESTNVVPGQTYYLRVYYENNIGTWPFEVSLITGPTYDQCATVTEFPMNYDYVVDTLTFASMMYSRINPITSMPFPFMTTGGLDEIWFKFTATSTDHTVFLGSRSYFSCWTMSSYPYLYAKYDGCTVADTMGSQTAVPLFFDSSGYVDFNSLTIGGTYYLRVWTNKMEGVSADFYAGVGPLGSTGQMPPPTSVSNNFRTPGQLTVTPNPGTFLLNIKTPGEREGQISISDMTGKEIYKTNATKILSLDINSYATGIYFIRYRSSTHTAIAKFLKQ